MAGALKDGAHKKPNLISEISEEKSRQVLERRQVVKVRHGE